MFCLFSDEDNSHSSVVGIKKKQNLRVNLKKGGKRRDLGQRVISTKGLLVVSNLDLVCG